MKVTDFDYELPPELIAQEPPKERGQSRLLVLHRETGQIEHRMFPDLLAYLREGDVLVLNRTRVLPARLYGRRVDTGGRVEVLLLTKLNGNTWEVLVQPGRRALPGTTIIFGDGKLSARVLATTEGGGRTLEFFPVGDLDKLLEELGEMPTPPYIKKKLMDPERYQTVYAREKGSAAAPTAGLHFTPELIEEIARRGVGVVTLLLHVGLGTFRPVKVENVEEHRMHAEYYLLEEEAAQRIREARRNGGRIIAVGTTTVRTLETVVRDKGEIVASEGWTDIFIYPGFQFRATDVLLTNFHLPRSTLLMLVSAFAGREKVLAAYREAVAQRYRFFSFGDAMLII